MKKFLCAAAVFCVCAANALFAVGEKKVALGGKSGWSAAGGRENIVELNGLRPNPVLSISSAKSDIERTIDLSLSFDEDNAARFRDDAGHYSITTTEEVRSSGPRWARRGRGAALFSGILNTSAQSRMKNGAPMVLRPLNSSALFAPGRNISDFSIEFFLFPNNLSSGEVLVNWQATVKSNNAPSRPEVSGKTGARNSFQSIICTAGRNRLKWDFENFFTSADGAAVKNVILTSNIPLSPKTWSHHLIRFDADTGLLEYLVDGAPQSIVYVTSNGREGGEVLRPVSGERGALLLGGDFTGLIDEFRIASAFIEIDSVHRYPVRGGRVETKPLDLGDLNCAVKKIDASGGRVKFSSRSILNEYAKSGDFRFVDDAQVQFFARIANSPWQLDSQVWTPFTSGAEISAMTGRYIQIAADFYPSGDLEAAPYLEEINIEYKEQGAPPAPENVIAIARDGAVDISWKPRRDDRTAGFMVYYGTKSGEYFSTDALQGESPIDAGKVSGFHLDNMKNGTLYFFSVVAYDDLGAFHQGGFSRETSARPLRMIE
jgi:hypothetical protein